MTLLELLQEGTDVLKTNKLRTGLSALGIIIGIGSVITLMTLGDAAQQSTIQRISALGSNLLTIRPGANSNDFLRSGSGNASTLTYDDAVALTTEQRISNIRKVAAEYAANAQVAFDRNNTNVSITGITPDYFEIRNIEVATGLPITQSDIELANMVAVIGPATSDTLFGTGVNPIGQSIKVNGQYFRIIGVTKAKGSVGRLNSDEVVFIPLTTAQQVVFGKKFVSAIYVSGIDEKSLAALQNQIGYFLLERHRISDPTKADFSISSSADLLETVSSVTATFTTLLTGIAAISLVVGGIGIMNIMLVTVTERTREIGIRKALGAKRQTVVMQFLLEAIILTLTGGVIGVLVGVGASLIITKVMNLPSVISYSSIGLALGVSSVVGIVFGWYPAQKASKLAPIEALRYE